MGVIKGTNIDQAISSKVARLGALVAVEDPRLRTRELGRSRSSTRGRGGRLEGTYCWVRNEAIDTQLPWRRSSLSL